MKSPRILLQKLEISIQPPELEHVEFSQLIRLVQNEEVVVLRTDADHLASVHKMMTFGLVFITEKEDREVIELTTVGRNYLSYLFMALAKASGGK